MEVTDGFQGLDLIDRVHEKLQTEVYNIEQKMVTKTITKKKKCKKAKWLSEEALLRKDEKQKAKDKEKEIPISMQSSRETQEKIRKPS